MIGAGKGNAKPWAVRLAFGVLLLTGSVASAAAMSRLGENYRLGYDKATEPCLPHRLYLISRARITPAVGDVIAFHTRGLEPIAADGTVYTKLVLGVPGDVVQSDPAGATVNGRRLPFTDRALKRLNTTGRALARQYTLQEGQYFMAGTNPTAFDSRYYGPVDADQFIGPARPLL